MSRERHVAWIDSRRALLGFVVSISFGCGDDAAAIDAGLSPGRDACAGCGDDAADRDAPPPDSARSDAGPPPVHEVHPDLAALPANTWALFEEGGVEFEGHLAYSGGTYDRTNHRFILFGGGHLDGWHNDLLIFDVAARTWSRPYETDTEDEHSCANVSADRPGMLLSSLRPASRHTYDGIEFLDHRSAVIVWSGSTYSGIWTCEGNHAVPDDTWLFDTATNEWRYANASRAPQPRTEGCAGAYDPSSRLYFAIDRDRFFEPRLWSYDAEADRWTMLSPSGPQPSIEMLDSGVLTTDRRRSRLFHYPYLYDVATNAWSLLEAEGTPPSEYGIESYDEANDVMVVPDGSVVRIYHVEENRWETLEPAGDPPPSRSLQYGRFFYDPVDGVHLLVQSSDSGNYGHSRVYAYRYR